jgi:plasmid maintenance system antidote protein VapI
MDDIGEPRGLSRGGCNLAGHARPGWRFTGIERLVHEETPVTPDTTLRLARYLGGSAEFWPGIEARYDLETARRALQAEIEEIEPR